MTENAVTESASEPEAPPAESATSEPARRAASEACDEDQIACHSGPRTTGGGGFPRLLHLQHQQLRDHR